MRGVDLKGRMVLLAGRAEAYRETLAVSVLDRLNYVVTVGILTAQVEADGRVLVVNALHPMRFEAETAQALAAHIAKQAQGHTVRVQPWREWYQERLGELEWVLSEFGAVEDGGEAGHEI